MNIREVVMKGRFVIAMIVSSWLVFSAGSGIASSRETGDRLGLRESISIAISKSLALDSAREEVKALEALSREARTAFYPSLSTSYSYTRLNETPEAPGIDFSFSPPVMKHLQVGTKNNYAWQFQLRQPLYAGGRIESGYEIQELGTRISRYDEKTALQDLVLEVTESYFGILKSERIRDVAMQSLEQLKAHRNRARSFYNVGIIPKNDLLFAELEVANGRQSLVRAENALQLAKARFNTLLRRDIDTPVRIEDILTYEPYEPDFDTCRVLGLEKRSELHSYEQRIEQVRKTVDLAKADFYPAVNLVGSYGRYGDTPRVSGSEYHEEYDWNILAVAEWNLWEWGKTKYAVSERHSRERQAINALGQIKDSVVLEIKNDYLFLREAEKHIFVAEKAIEQAEENLRINNERYNQQVATSTDVIDAQTILTGAKSDYYNALSDYNIAHKRLERSMGVIGETGDAGISVEKMP